MQNEINNNDNIDTPSESNLLVRMRTWPSIKITLVRYYDEIGKFMLANMLWFALSLPIVTIPAATFGLCRFCRDLLAYKEPEVRTVFNEGFKTFLLRSYLFFGLFSVMVALSSFGLVFYLRMFEVFGPVALFLAAIIFMVLLFTFMVGFYAPALIVHQDIGILLAVKRACMLAGAKPTVTWLLLFVCFCFGILTMILPPVFLLLFTPSFCLTMMNVATLLALDELEP